MIFTEGTEDRDTSSVAIAACGMLEIAKNLPLTDEYKNVYENYAVNIIKSLTDNYTTKNIKNANSILTKAVYGKKDHSVSVEEANIWGDYFYFEALVRMKKNWKLYW